MASSAKCINNSMLKYQNMLLQDVIKENKGLRQTLQKTEKDARQLQGMKSQLFEKDRLIYRL